MAREYYFDDVLIPGLYKNHATKAKKVGIAFAHCVYDTLKEYGVPLYSHFESPQMIADHFLGRATEEFKARIAYYRDGEAVGNSPLRGDGIDITLTEWSRMLVDFKFDPLIAEASNDQIMADIKAKAVEKKLIGKNTRIYTTGKQGFIQSEKELGPRWWMI